MIGAVMVPIVTAATALMVATFRKRGLEIEILKDKREDKVLSEAKEIVVAKAQVAEANPLADNFTLDDVRREIIEIVTSESTRKKLGAPSVQKMEAVVANVQTQASIAPSPEPLPEGPLPPPPQVPNEARHTMPERPSKLAK
jgi:hypothetical protein